MAELGRDDASQLRKKLPHSPPKPFVAPGRDGKTPIYGMLYFPSNFDAKRSYPVVQKVYAGPHGAHVIKTFCNVRSVQELAEIGFVGTRV